MIAQHSSKTNEHYTPEHIVEAARATMGGIDLDPASCAEANATVRATHYYNKENEGFALRWAGPRVFVNPPGGKATPEQAAALKTRSSACAWWYRTALGFQSKEFEQAVFVGFTLELLRSAQVLAGAPHPFDFPLCVPAQRLCFRGTDPTHANVIIYLGPHVERFRENFEPIGRCLLTPP